MLSRTFSSAWFLWWRWWRSSSVWVYISNPANASPTRWTGVGYRRTHISHLQASQPLPCPRLPRWSSLKSLYYRLSTRCLPSPGRREVSVKLYPFFLVKKHPAAGNSRVRDVPRGRARQYFVPPVKIRWQSPELLAARGRRRLRLVRLWSVWYGGHFDQEFVQVPAKIKGKHS